MGNKFDRNPLSIKCSLCFKTSSIILRKNGQGTNICVLVSAKSQLRSGARGTVNEPTHAATTTYSGSPDSFAAVV
ncbi:hypothetical protein RJ640_015866 [Escallonia rubra]|uniref:Uncharacterized protein n=1 Tax=Escallonia rubra TaxID=112253 RepID=A0AA88RPM6_9ASTE|nr:hypothetical protein RJ640_015866 [Escallonia rubra]